MKKEFWKGIKKAVTDIKNAGGYTNFKVYANVKTGEVWTCLYTDCNGYELYDDSDIITVRGGTCGCSIMGKSYVTAENLIEDCENAKDENDENEERRKIDEENAEACKEADREQREEYEEYVRVHGTDVGY